MSNKLQIIVQGEPLDLIEGEETRFFITRILQDLSDLSTRNSDFTNTISIPNTNTNLRLIGNQVPDVARFSETSITNVDCQVLLGGLPVLSDAYFLVSNQTDSQMRLTVFSGTAKFFANIRDESIKALNFSEYDLNWTLADLQDIADTTEGVCYPRATWFTTESIDLMFAQGGDTLRTAVNENYLAESGFYMYCHTILNKIFETVNRLSFDTSNLDLKYFEAGIPCPVPIIHDQYTSLTGVYSEVRNELGNDIPNGRVEFTVLTDDSGFWSDINDEYTITNDGTFVVRCRFQGDIRAVNGLVFTLRDSGGNTLAQTTVESQGNSTRSYDLTILTSVEVNGSETLYIESAVVDGNGTTTKTLDFASFSIEEQGIGRGDRVAVADFLPDISQRDFVREMFNLFNIIPTINAEVVTLNYFDEITKGSTLKLDVSKQITRSASLLSYGQTSILKYADNEDVSREDANSFFQVDSLTLQREVVVIGSRRLVLQMNILLKHYQVEPI